MKKASKTTKSQKTSAKPRRVSRTLGGGREERRWLTLFATLILAVVLSALLVVFIKQNLNYNSDKYNDSSKNTKLTSPTAREERIRAIFATFELDDSFEITREDIFGEKRVYEWDDGRTYSSSREYRRDKGVEDTRAVARQAIEKAGFTMFDEPYAGSVASQYHFKNSRGEYVRLSVLSQSVLSTTRDTEPLTDKEKWAAPSIVTIKVNLDDNNE